MYRRTYHRQMFLMILLAVSGPSKACCVWSPTCASLASTTAPAPDVLAVVVTVGMTGQHLHHGRPHALADCDDLDLVHGLAGLVPTGRGALEFHAAHGALRRRLHENSNED